MAEMTPDRLAELRRIAEAATPGPWEWRMSKDGRILDLITLETGYNEEIITPSHVSAWLQVNRGLKDYIPAFDPTTALELLDALAAARAESERWKRRHDALRAAVIKADELIVDAINHATEMYNHTQDDYYESYSDGLDEALMILQLVLSEVDEHE